MAYLTLARKYRPQDFDGVVGQSHITQTLKNSLESGRISHAYLFSGPRGIGKTSTARILAKCLNCEKGPTVNPCGKCSMCLEITEGSSMDIVEIDAASHRGIDEAKDLIEKVRFVSGAARYKMYIIDEVHMLTPQSFNALLKTIEEPPPNVIFVLATTAPHDIPQTILSRCQWFVFRRISVQDMIKHLARISSLEKIKISESSLFAIARHSEGSLRDAEVSLEQVISFSGTDVQDEDVSAPLGVIKLDFYRNYFKGIITGDVQSAVSLTGEIMDSGYEIDDFIQGLQEYARNLIVLKDGQARVSDANLSLVDLPVEDVKKLKEETACFSEEELVWMVDAISQAQKDLHNFGMGGQERLILELMAIRLVKHGIKKQAGAASKNPEARQVAVQPTKDHAPVPPPPTVPHPAPQEQDKPKVVPAVAPKVGQAQPASRSDNEDPRPAPAPKEKIAPGHKEISLEAVLEGWGSFVQIIKEKKPGMAQFLEEARPKELKEGTLTVSFNKELEFQRKRAEEKEDKSFIESTLKEVYSVPLKIKYLPGDHAQEEKIKKAEDEPLLKKTLEIFKAKIVDRKKIQ